MSLSEITWRLDLEGLQKALADGADPNEVKYDDPVFFMAIERGWAEGLQAFIAAGVDLTLKNERMDTPLIQAVIHKKADAARILIEGGAEIEAPNKIGYPPLNYVVKMNAGQESTVTTTTTYEDGSTSTATIPASVPQQAAMEVAKVLLAAGANVNAPNEQGQVALLHATASGDATWTRLLLEHGADATAVSGNGYSILHGAAASGSAEIVGLVLASGADPNVVDSAGFAPLHEAVMADAEDCVRALLESGADRSLAVSEGWDVVKPGMTALDIAKAKSLDALVAVLEG